MYFRADFLMHFLSLVVKGVGSKLVTESVLQPPLAQWQYDNPKAGPRPKKRTVELIEHRFTQNLGSCGSCGLTGRQLSGIR